MSYIKEKTENKIVDFKSCDTILKGFDKIIFLNMIEGIIPSKKVNNLFFLLVCFSVVNIYANFI